MSPTRLLPYLIKIDQNYMKTFYSLALAGYHTYKDLWELRPNMGRTWGTSGGGSPTKEFLFDEKVRTVI